MIEKTEGIALRIVPYSRTSHVVSWITSSHGQMTTLVKGAQRPKSIFLGQYDLFYSCEIVVYVRNGGAVHIMKECYPLNPRPFLRTHWRPCACASYLCDLTSRMVPAGGHPAELYPLLEHSLDALCEEGTPERPLADWFGLRMMQISGFGPQLTRCTVCRKDISETGSDVLFLCSRGGVLCPRCAGSGERPIPLRPDVLAILRHWQRCDSPEAAVRVSCSEEQLSQIGSVLKLFLEYHMEATFSSADILEHLLRREDGQVPERSMRQAHTE